MQRRPAGDSGGDRIRHSRFEGNAPEAAHAFVMRQLEALPKGCVLEIEFALDPSSFRENLLAVLAECGAPARVRKIARRRWVLLLQPSGERELMDLCDLEAPLPMERILEAAAELQPGEALIAHTPCLPRPLLAQLDRRGLEWEAAEAADASGLVWVGRPG
jgi:uncharacterized protein (DUF2249 family)